MGEYSAETQPALKERMVGKQGKGGFEWPAWVREYSVTQDAFARQGLRVRMARTGRLRSRRATAPVLTVGRRTVGCYV